MVNIQGEKSIEMINNPKSGFTTGSAAAAATKAAVWMLLTGKVKDEISLITPVGKEYCAKVYGCDIGDNYATCYCVKESGDDPDVTAGMKIYSTVTRLHVDNSEPVRNIIIRGGKGIGKVTRPGLDQPVGEAAINSVPRKMITTEAVQMLEVFDCYDNLEITIWAPEGEEIAKKTFNAHMGIEGGISIIGTTGIVEPMSTQALLDTIKVDIAMQYAEGQKVCIMAPGNYGVTFLKNSFDIEEKNIVTCSNFVGDSLKMAVERGFKKILFVSHIGKLIKVSGGIMNTHSQYGDHRMELMKAAFKEAVTNKMASKDEMELDEANISQNIMDCVSTTAALEILEETGMVESVSQIIVKKAVDAMKKLIKDIFGEESQLVELGCIMYENKYGELYKTANVEKILDFYKRN